MKTTNACVAIVLILLMFAAIVPAQGQSTYVVAGRLVDSLSAKVVSNPVIDIRGDRIGAVTSDGKVPDHVKTIIGLGDVTILPISSRSAPIRWKTFARGRA